jgi:hypothetical protein
VSDRKHLTAGEEIEKLLAATQGSRREARDRCLLLLMFRHSEACGFPRSRMARGNEEHRL